LRWPDWTGRTVAILASGPSTKKAGVHLLKDRITTFAIKRNVELAPWAEAVYGCDYPWWKSVRGLPDFKGAKFAYADRACDQFGCQKVKIPDVKADRLVFDEVGSVGAGGNSGFQALNLAVQFGASRVILVGFDFTGEHWYGRNNWQGGGNPSESNFKRWRTTLDAAAPVLAERGVEVVNASPNSTVKAYPKRSIEDALKSWGLLQSEAA
jgi:hypothetical protein